MVRILTSEDIPDEVLLTSEFDHVWETLWASIFTSMGFYSWTDID